MKKITEDIFIEVCKVIIGICFIMSIGLIIMFKEGFFFLGLIIFVIGVFGSTVAIPNHVRRLCQYLSFDFEAKK